MNTPRHNLRLHALQAALMITGGCVAADARAVRTTFTVGATVAAVARIDRQSAPVELLVSAEDARRGFIDVVEPTALVISSNSPAGFVLDLMTVTPILSSVIVWGFESEQVLGAEGGTVVQRWQGAQTQTLSLRFRFVLAGGIAAGRYAWPMRFRARPLESV